MTLSYSLYQKYTIVSTKYSLEPLKWLDNNENNNCKGKHW